MAIKKVKTGITDPVGGETLYQKALRGDTGATTGTTTGNTGALPFKVSDGITFGAADQNQQSLLRNAANLYGSGENWVESLNPLRTTGNFVSYMDENGMPVGALRSVSGPTNGEYLWALNGKMATGSVPEGTIVYAPDGSRWNVGKDGLLASAGTYTPTAPTVPTATSPATNGRSATSPSTSPSATPVGKVTESSSSSATTPYMAALDEYGQAPTYGGSPYDAQRDEYLRRAGDMSFSYDPATDPSWQAYQKQYRREGQRATQDTLGQYAAMTGGSPSSWAVTAATQAGDYYGAQLADKLPQLYQDAYNRYLQEYQRMLGLSQEYGSLGQTDYNRYLDQLNQFNTDRNFQYGLNRDAVEDARYQQEYSDQRADLDWDRQYTLDRDAVADARYAQEWEQQQRQYEDQRADQALANERYEREYADQQAAAERESEANSVYAYSGDGGTYQINSDKGFYFIDYAQPGAQMIGGDGSLWKKSDDGSTVTIEKNGKIFTYSVGSGYNPYETIIKVEDAKGPPAPPPESPRDTGEASPENAYNMQSVGNARDLVSAFHMVGAAPVLRGDPTRLDYDPDEGIFRWNGKTYGKLSDIATAIDNADLSNKVLELLAEKFSRYGFTVKFD